MQSSAELEALAGYTEVSGMLEISGSEDLVCLDALACLETVGRDLRVQDNAALRSTAGLRNLRMLGAAYDEPKIGRAAMFIGNNAALEVFEGSALEGYVNHLVIWDNPSLVDVADLHFEQIDALSVLNNPRLQALSSLHDLTETQCFINHNPVLCSTELRSVCTGPDEDSWAYNGIDCPEGPPDPIAPDSQGDECSTQVEDCPEGEKCTWWFIGDVVCRPVVSEPRAVGETCTSIDVQDGLDDCERHATCREGTCWAVAFGRLGSLTCPRSDEYAMFDAGDDRRYCAPACDPLANECRSDQVCAPWGLHGVGLTCQSSYQSAPSGLGEQCQSHSCGTGLGCVSSQWSSVCEAEAEVESGTCCLPFCDLGEPECPPGSTCIPWWDEDEYPLPKLEHVGFCAET